MRKIVLRLIAISLLPCMVQESLLAYATDLSPSFPSHKSAISQDLRFSEQAIPAELAISEHEKMAGLGQGGRHRSRVRDLQQSSTATGMTRRLFLAMTGVAAAAFAQSGKGPAATDSASYSEKDMEYARESVHLYTQEFTKHLDDAIILSHVKPATPRGKAVRTGVVGAIALTVGIGIIIFAFGMGILRARSEVGPRMDRRRFMRSLRIAVLGLYAAVWAQHFRMWADRQISTSGFFDPADKMLAISRDQMPNDTVFRFHVDHELAHMFGRYGLGVLEQEMQFANSFALFLLVKREGRPGLRRLFDWSKASATKSYPMTWEEAYYLAKKLYREVKDPRQREAKLIETIMAGFPGREFDRHLVVDGSGQEWVYLYGIAIGSIAEEFANEHGGSVQIGLRYLWALTNKQDAEAAERFALDKEHYLNMIYPTNESDITLLNRLEPSSPTGILNINGIADVARALLAMVAALGLTWGGEKMTRRRMKPENRWTIIGGTVGAMLGYYRGFDSFDSILLAVAGAITFGVVTRVFMKWRSNKLTPLLTAILLVALALAGAVGLHAQDRPVQGEFSPQSAATNVVAANEALTKRLAEIDAMTEMAGLGIEEIEKHMVVGTHLKPILKADAILLNRLGVTSEELADHLVAISRLPEGEATYDGTTLPNHHIQGMSPQKLTIEILGSRGMARSIFYKRNGAKDDPDNQWWDKTITITNPANGLSIRIFTNEDDPKAGTHREVRLGYLGDPESTANRLNPDVLIGILTGKPVTKKAEEQTPVKPLASGRNPLFRTIDEYLPVYNAANIPSGPPAPLAYKLKTAS